MAHEDRTRWDERYQGSLGQRVSEPDPFLCAVLDELGPGAGRPALDLAAGMGRHALELAQRGFAAEAWDASPEGLGILSRRAAERGLSVSTQAVDLDGQLPPRQVSLVTMIHYLNRALFERLASLLQPGGDLVIKTFTTERPGERPSARFCLEPGELMHPPPGFVAHRYEESEGQAGLWARRS